MKAISVRQPWAHLILHAGKVIENRDWATRYRGKLFLHAARTMLQQEYEACVLFCATLPESTLPKDFCFPTFESLQAELGGIVGEIEIADCVTTHPSPWFVGRYGFVIKHAQPVPIQKCNGMPGIFEPRLMEAGL